jgi:uncharacterized membrane protein YqjE
LGLAAWIALIALAVIVVLVLVSIVFWPKDNSF